MKSFPISKLDELVLGVDADGLPQQDPRVALLAQGPPDRRGDVAGREAAGRNLIEQRLKEVEVASIHDREVDGRAPQLLCGIEAPETASEDHDAVSCRLRHTLESRLG